MATLADALVTSITTNYGGGGGGGATPANIVNLNEYIEISPFNREEEWIAVWIPSPAKRDPINEHYANVTQEVKVLIVTPTSDDRLKEIKDELIWVINNNAVTGINYQWVGGDIDRTDRRGPTFMMELTSFFLSLLVASEVAYSASATTHTHDAEDVIIATVDAPTYNDVRDWFNIAQSAGVISGAVISDGGGGTVNIAAGTGVIKITDSAVGTTKFIDIPVTTGLALTDANTNYIYVDYNTSTGVVTVAATVTRGDIDGRTEFTLGRAYRDGATVHIANLGSQVAEHCHISHERLVAVRGFERADGAVTSDEGSREFAITAGTFYLADNKVNTSSVAAGATFKYFYSDGGAGFTYADATVIDNAHYDDGDGVLGNVTANQHATHWIYMHWDDHVYVQYGTQNGNLAQAKAATSPIPSSLVGDFGALIAKIITKQGVDAFVSIETPWNGGFTGTPVTDHGDLGGLTDDDHTQYLRVDGTRAGTGNQTFGGDVTVNNLITAGNVDGVDVSALKTGYDAHRHDGHTLQFDEVNSDGGAFAFNTTGGVTFNQWFGTTSNQMAIKIGGGAADTAELLMGGSRVSVGYDGAGALHLTGKAGKTVKIYTDNTLACTFDVLQHATFANDVTADNFITAGNVDGVDVSAHAADGTIHFTMLDEDNMVTDSATQAATQQSIKAYVDAAILTEDTLAEMNDVVLTAPADNEVLAYNNATSKWINQTPAEANLSDTSHRHNGHTLQLDAINSDGGAFAFNTTGIVTFNQNVTVPNLVTAGNVDGVDVSVLLSTYNTHAAESDIHAAHSGISIVAGTGMSGGGTITQNRTLNCDITQYTDALAVVALEGERSLHNLAPAGSGTTWHFESSEDTILEIEGDMNNDDETKHGWLKLYQDGRAVYLSLDSGSDNNKATINASHGLNLQMAGATKLEVTATGASVTGAIVVSGNVDGVDVSSLPALITANTTPAEAVAAVVAENPLTLTNDLTVSGGQINITDGGYVYGGGSRLYFDYAATTGLGVYGAATDPTVDTIVNLGVSANALKIYTNDGYVTIGPQNTSWCHMSTDRAAFYFNKPIAVVGDCYPYTDSSANCGQDAKRWLHIYGDAMTIGGNIIVGGTVDGIDIAAHVAAENPHGMEHDDLTDTTLSGAGVEDLHQFGSSNKAWQPFVFEMANNVAQDYGFTNFKIRNVTANDDYWLFRLPIPTAKGIYRLHLGDLRVGVFAADANDYINHVYVAGVIQGGAHTVLIDDGTNRTTPNQYTYTLADTAVNGYETIVLMIRTTQSTASQLTVSSVEIETHYAI